MSRIILLLGRAGRNYKMTRLAPGDMLQTGVAARDFVTPEARPWHITTRSAHENVWRSVTLTTNPIPQKVYAEEHSYVELATALNRLLPDRQGRDSPWRRGGKKNRPGSFSVDAPE